MKPQKNNKGNKNTPQNFAQKYRNLPILEKEKVTNFFNLHNAATWMYLQMSQAAQEYTQEAISCSATAMSNQIQEAVETLKEE